MEEDKDEATQPATQLVVDPRRLGQQGESGLSEDDVADIFCILHPLTLPACKAAVEVYHATAQHAINSSNDVQIYENNVRPSDDVEEYQLEAENIAPCDIALRLSSRLKDPPAGFVFGRNKTRCDIVIGENQQTKRISNVHFRIHINVHGIIMLEDQSTNGTAVDGTLLRGKDKENGHNYRHTLTQGSVIVLTMTPPEVDYRFIVRIPQRDEESDLAYQQNLTAFFLRMNTAAMGNAGQGLPPPGGKTEPVNLFPNPTTTTPNATFLPSVGKSIREWKGGSKYNKIGRIGKGAFAVVYKITAKFDGIPYAAKELEKRRFMKNGVLDQKVDTEMNIMRKIQHPNVVRFIEHVDFEDKLYIIMEFVPNGDLGSLIGQSENGHLPEADVRAMAGQLLSALSYLHEKGITHRDVKPDNILISSRDPLCVKLTDFGLSKMIDSEETFLRTFCGTLLYCAPEVYSEYREYDIYGQRTRRDKRTLPPQRYGHAVDIWSLAGVLFLALCGSPPYRVKQGAGYQELLNQIMTIALDIRPLQRAGVSETGTRFVRKMLRIRPEHRATIAELEESSWLTGGDDTFAMSMEEEDASLVDDLIDPYLQQEASQLSIQDENRQVEDSGVFGSQNFNDIESIQQGKIPSSFSTDDAMSSESLEYVPATAPRGNGIHPANHNGRLFGEVGPSGHFEIARPNAAARQFEFDDNDDNNDNQDSQYTQSEPGATNPHMQSPRHVAASAPTTTIPPSMPPPSAPHAKVMAIRGQEYRPPRPSSLHFAESMVEQLNMNSPAPEPYLKQPDSPAATIEDLDPSMAASLRRSRYEYENDQQSDNWIPEDLPHKRRRQSNREIHMHLPASVFWDPRDRSTHHYNYPRMTNVEWEAFQEYAKTKGEEFRPGGKTFENTMQSFRSMSRSPSVEPEGAARAQSEPTKAEGRRMMMKRDERHLSGELPNSKELEPSREVPPNDKFMSVNHRSDPHPGAFSPPTTSRGISESPISSPSTDVLPLIGNDFQEPKKILARFMATTDSCLPTITFNITDPFTSWGRSSGNTLRSTNDKRIPDHALKLFLFKPGYYSNEQSFNHNAVKWTSKEQDMTFYVSSKAPGTIYINNVQLRSYACNEPDTESKYWGELRHQDVVTVWWDKWTGGEFIRFRFECLWGKSREPRYSDGFDILEKGPLLMEIEKTCSGVEERITHERNIRKREEKKHIETSGETSKDARVSSLPTNITQSFSVKPNNG